MKTYYKQQVPRGWLAIVSTFENGFRFGRRLSTRLSLVLCSDEPDESAAWRKKIEDRDFEYVDYFDFPSLEKIEPNRRTVRGRALLSLLNHPAWTSGDVSTLRERHPVVGPLPNDPDISVVEWKGDYEGNYCLIVHCADENGPEHWMVSAPKDVWLAVLSGISLLDSGMTVEGWSDAKSEAERQREMTNFKEYKRCWRDLALVDTGSPTKRDEKRGGAA